MKTQTYQILKLQAYIRRLLFFLAILSVTLLSSCSTGPDTVLRDRFDYGTAIGESWKRETLLNIVKMRYADTPIFMEVSQVIQQYSLESQAETRSQFWPGEPGDWIYLGGWARYYDRPTITYKPLVGKQFTKSVLEPIPPYVVFFLIQSGWEAGFVMRTCVRSINGIVGFSSLKGGLYNEDTTKFDRVVEIIQKLKNSGALMPTSLVEGEINKIKFITSSDNLEIAGYTRQLKELLGLNQELNEFPLLFGMNNADSNEIAIMPRSIFEIMVEFAFQIDVPEKHIAEGRVRTDEKNLDDLYHILKVQVSKKIPEYPFASVYYQNHWFYVDDRDFSSKRSFTFLKILLSLTETGVDTGGAMVTISAGG
jgi:hypothetical protein